MAVSNKLKASHCWRNLSGLLCLYKPLDITLGRLVNNIRLIIPDGLNKMEVRPPRKIVQYDTTYGIPLETIETDYSDHPLVIGKRYIKDDVRYYCASSLGVHSSGVCVVGLNRDRYLAKDLDDSKPLKVYRLVGQLGIATDNLYKDGKVVERATYSKVFRPVIDKVLAAMQASHQRMMYIQSGVPIQSQTAYELAVKGLIRPANDTVPILYGIKCVDFEKPFFTVEVTCVNETEDYLLTLIHTIGVKVRSVARCNSIKCIRYGPFTLDHALLQHSWNAQNFAQNIQMCNAINEQDIKSGRRENVKLCTLDSTQGSSVDINNKPPEPLRATVKLRGHQLRRQQERLQSKEH